MARFQIPGIQGGSGGGGVPTWPVSYAANYRGHYDSLRPVRLKPVFTHAHTRTCTHKPSFATVGIVLSVHERDRRHTRGLQFEILSFRNAAVISGQRNELRVLPTEVWIFDFGQPVFLPEGNSVMSTNLGKSLFLRSIVIKSHQVSSDIMTSIM